MYISPSEPREPSESIDCGCTLHSTQYTQLESVSGPQPREELRSSRCWQSGQSAPSSENMFPKDTSSEDPGPPPASEAGGVQTESGMRSIFQNTQTQPPTSASLSEASDNPNNVNITVAPFTGGPFQVKISKMETVEELKKVIARRLKVSKERIYLLYRER